MKVAIYSGVIPSTTFIENLIKGVADKGVKVYLFGKIYKKSIYPSSNIFVFPTPNKKWEVILFVLLKQLQLLLQSRHKFQKLRQYILSRQPVSSHRWRLWAKYLPVVLHLPDIFHIQWAKGIEDWEFLQTLFGVEIVISLRGGQINTAPPVDQTVAAMYKKSFPQVKAFHAVSEAIAREALKYGASFDKIRVVYSGINRNKIGCFEKKSYELQQPIRLLSVGRFHWKKGYHYALDALKIIVSKGYQFHYTIIAGGNSEEILYQIHDLGLQQYVSILDKMPQEKVFEYMQNSDLLLLPSVEEGIANVVLEAMAIGLPVISSDYGGMTEIIKNAKNGFLFNNRDLEDMCIKLIDFVNLDSKHKCQIAIEAKKSIKLQHSLPESASQMIKIYKSLLKIAK